MPEIAGRQKSLRWKMLSTTMIASSMTMRTASARATRLIMFRLRFATHITPKPATIEVGIASAEMSVARPLVRFVERAEHNAADQFQPVFGQGVRQNGGVFRHEAHGTQFDALVPCLGTFLQNLLPAGVAGIISKFNAPAGRIPNTNCHFA
jgi:hypothetical protein